MNGALRCWRFRSVVGCLAIGAKEQRHGHLGVPQDGAPLVLPVDYAVHGPDVVLRIGEGLFHQLDGRLVAFQVDGVSRMGDQSERIWSVLVQGLAIEDSENVPTSHVPHPEVVDPGRTGRSHPCRRCDWPSLSDLSGSCWRLAVSLCIVAGTANPDSGRGRGGGHWQRGHAKRTRAVS